MKKMVKKRLPGTFIRVLSFVPLINWISLLYIGVINNSTISIACGIIYGFLTFVNSTLAPYIWLIGIIHYIFIYRWVDKHLDNSQSQQNNTTSLISQQSQQCCSTLTTPQQSPQNLPFNPQQEQQNHTVDTTNVQPIFNNTISDFSDVTISGKEEQKQTIPTEISPQQIYSSDYSGNKFIQDMHTYANKEEAIAQFEPFSAYWPTYSNMNHRQQTWYFYWRSQVRNGNYPDTDISYIFIHVYELLNGVGWEVPQNGYEQITKLWSEYQERFPKLNYYLFDWAFDFAQLYNLEHDLSLYSKYLPVHPSPKIDILIEKHSEEVPLKLTFSLIDVLCDYSLVNSKFYQDGHQSLMQEAIPRIISLADAALRKKTNKGILSTYGPNRTKKQQYYLFQCAIHPEANNETLISVKAYSSNQRLREYINQLVRYSENVLRTLYNCRGRLRGVTLDEEMSKLIKSFLTKEYNPIPLNNTLIEKNKLTLNFDSINELREQSNAVRIALQVDEPNTIMSKELLTDIKEVTAIYISLTSEAQQVLTHLYKSNWTCEQITVAEPLTSEINKLAERYIGCDLLVKENNIITVEEDYRDELDYIFNNSPQIPQKHVSSTFDLSLLAPNMKEFIETLAPEQEEVLYIVLTQENPQDKLNQIAETYMTMPQIIVDDINETAIQVLGDIIIDAMGSNPQVLDEYAVSLKQSIA